MKKTQLTIGYLIASGLVFSSIVMLAGAFLALFGMLLSITIIGILPGLFLITEGVLLITFVVIHFLWFLLIGAALGYFLKPLILKYITWLKTFKK